MRIGCLQFAPEVGKVDSNVSKADAVLSRANPEDLRDLDLLVLPELAMTGYNFKSLDGIAPFLEVSGAGTTWSWARKRAIEHACTVVVGYPEKVDVTAKAETAAEPTPRASRYNAATIVNKDGELVGNYRKSFLYYTDETWALEGQGFFKGELPGLGRAAMGICMDINPYKFEAPENAYEFAVHVLKAEANLVILSMAWLTNMPGAFFNMRPPHEPDMMTLTYWLNRMSPLIWMDNDKKDDEEVIVVFCNRCGTEGEVVYAGTSAVVGLKKDKILVYGLLGRSEEKLLVVDTKKRPRMRLVRPSKGQEKEGGEEEERREDGGEENVSQDNQQNHDTTTAT